MTYPIHYRPAVTSRTEFDWPTHPIRGRMWRYIPRRFR